MALPFSWYGWQDFLPKSLQKKLRIYAVPYTPYLQPAVQAQPREFHPYELTSRLAFELSGDLLRASL